MESIGGLMPKPLQDGRVSRIAVPIPPDVPERKSHVKITVPLAAVAAALTLAAPAYAVNEYDIKASTSPTKSGTTSKPTPVGVNLGFTTRDPEGGRPLSMEQLTVAFDGMRVNTNAFAKCSATAITQAKNDSKCPSGSLIATGYARNLAGDRNNRADRSISCYLSLRLHNSGNNKLALFVKGDPNAPGDKSCPIDLATAIPISVVRNAKGASLRLAIPESLKHPLATLTNSVVEMNLKVARKTTKVKGKTIGLFETTGRCVNRKRTVTLTFNNEGGNVAKQSTRASCS